MITRGRCPIVRNTVLIHCFPEIAGRLLSQRQDGSPPASIPVAGRRIERCERQAWVVGSLPASHNNHA